MAGKQVLTAKSILNCAHGGTVDLDPSQSWVRIGGREVLVEPDTVNRPVKACPMATPTTPPCSKTVNADKGASFSELVKIDGHGMCLATATGMTDWSRMATTPYFVSSPAQDFVAVEGG
jgi:hypothetical protein